MSEEPPAKLRLKTLVPGPGPERDHSAVHDVKAILQANLRHEKDLHVNQPIPQKKKKSRRMRDYITSLVLANGLILMVLRLTGFNLMSVCFGLGGVVVATLGITWIMFQVMDDY